MNIEWVIQASVGFGWVDRDTYADRGTALMFCNVERDCYPSAQFRVVWRVKRKH